MESCDVAIRALSPASPERADLPQPSGSRSNLPMKAIKTYPTRIEADLAKIALDAAGVPSVVVGIGVGMEGGAAGVQLLVPDDCVEAALTVLEDA
jgi:putative signal transducing protein